MEELRQIGDRAMDAALAAGADEVQLLLSAARKVHAGVRLGELDLLEEAESRRLSLRVFRDGRAATVTSSALSDADLRTLAADAVALAAITEPDETKLPPSAGEYADQMPDLDLADPGSIATGELVEMAREAESAALDADKRIDNSQGAQMQRSESRLLLRSSRGFDGESHATMHALSVLPVATDASGEKVTDSWAASARHLSDLPAPVDLGREAARRVLAGCDATKAPSGSATVIFEAPFAARLLGLLATCLSARAIWRERSYLADRLGEIVASSLVSVIDDPHLPRGVGSRPFDGEGIGGEKLALVENGHLRSWLSDLESSRHLGLPATGHGQWGGGVSPSNLFIEPGPMSLEDMIFSVDEGLLVTGFLGRNFDSVSGHWSQGCSGLWIRGGRVAGPVKEVTVAGNLDAVLGAVDAVGNDISFLQGSIASPSLRVASLTVGGSGEA